MFPVLKSIFEEEGRFISLEFGKYIIASIYFPSGSSGEERQKMKYEFMDLFEKYVKKEMKKINHLALGMSTDTRTTII